MRRIPQRCAIGILLFPALAQAQDAPPDEGALAAEEAAAQRAQEDQWLEGHSHLGESFNEGPRQRAYLMEGVAGVHMEITSVDERSQAFFDQGLAQLHGFWFLESERSFRQVAAFDPDCAMAYWGMAMSNFEEEWRGMEFAREAWLRREGTSEFERLHIEAIARYFEADYEAEGEGGEAKESEEAAAAAQDDDAAYPEDEPAELEPQTTKEKVDEALDKGEETREKLAEPKKPKGEKKERSATLVKDLEEIIFEFPDEIETKALLVNQLWLNRRAGHPTPSRMANQALLDQVFAVNPMHPAHHYRIHLWDAKDTAKRVVSSAARCGQSLPGIAHMWHMSGHIFDKLHRYQDAAWQQEASARVDYAHMMRDRVLPDQIHNFAHNNEWLTRSLRNSGQVRGAVELAKNMIEMPRHPKYNTLDKRSCSASWGRRRLLETLELFELWDELLALSDTMYLEPSEDAGDEGVRAFLLGEAHAWRGEQEQLEAQVAVLEALLVQERAARHASADEAEAEAIAAEKSEDEIHDAMKAAMRGHARTIRELEKSIAGLPALGRLVAAVGTEEELAADLKTIEDTRVPEAHVARLALTACLPDRALELTREAMEEHDKVAYTIANAAYLLAEAGEREEAEAAFEELLALSSRFELELPVFARLAPLAESLGHAGDWRSAHTVPEDSGERPPLDSLGPIRWTPMPAPDWTLTSGFSERVSLADYKGKPVLVIFFLGFGCVHCVEQLNEFRPKAQEYIDAGIQIVAIGTDAVADLRSSQADDDLEERLRMPILSDPEFDVFQSYRAYDDFEDLPLHGTFLIDGEGLVRWQDISYEPFLEPDFLLAESKRLLGLPAPQVRTAAAGGAEDAERGL